MATSVAADAHAPRASDARARRREAERLSRLRREQNLRAMRDQAATLHKVLRCLGQEAPLRLPDPREDDAADAEEESRLRRFLRLSMALVTECKLLRDERFRLISQLGKRQQFEATVRTAVAARRADLSSDAGNDGAHDGGLGHEIALPQPWSAAVTSALFEPWPAAAVAAHLRDSLDAIRRFTDNTDHVNSGHSFMGWSDSRRLDEQSGRLQFSFSKTFPNTNAAQFFEQFWEMQFSADKLRRYNLGFSTQVGIELLQRVSRDVAIQRRDTLYAGMPTRFHTVLLLFRQKTPTGSMACLRTVPAAAIQRAITSDPQSAWVSHFHWTHIDAVDAGDGRGETSCRISFCGSVATGDTALAHRWMLELAAMLVRGETALLGPRRLPRS